MLRRHFTATLLAAACAAPAFGTEYPSRTIRLIVPFPAGSTTDAMARFLGEKAAKELKQSVIVDNRPGAQGSIAASEVARAAADGYTLLVGTNSTQAANVHLFEKLSYDPRRDFSGITQFAINPLVMVTRADFPASNVQEFIAQAKAKKDGLNYGVGNTGSLVTVSKLMKATGFDAVAVNYPGSPQAIADVLAGRLDFMITDVSVTRAHIESGKLKALAVTTAERVPSLPNVPTMEQAGVKGYEFAAWGGLFAPANTPKAAVDTLNKAFVAAINSPEGRAFFERQGQIGAPLTPAAFDQLIVSEIDTWGSLLKQAGVTKQ